MPVDPDPTQTVSATLGQTEEIQYAECYCRDGSMYGIMYDTLRAREGSAGGSCSSSVSRTVFGAASRITSLGFPVGAVREDGERVVFNHLSFVVKYNQAEHSDGNRIVGFEVQPYSIAHHRRDT